MSKKSPVKFFRLIESALNKFAYLVLNDSRYDVVSERLEAEMQEARDKADVKMSPIQKRAAVLIAIIDSESGHLARDFERQVAEIQIRIAVLNRYTALGIPVTEPVGEIRLGKGEPVPHLICATKPCWRRNCHRANWR